MIQRYLTVQFGPSYAGCDSVGYTLRDAGGDPIGERTAAGIVEVPIGSGSFGALLSLPDDFAGSIAWDTGGENPVFAIEELNLAVAAPPLNGSIASGGAGPIPWTYQLLNQDNRPITQADVYVSTDAEGRNVVAVGRTDAVGIARFRLSLGQVFLWRSRSGCTFTNPDTRTVEAPA